jgi:hypothetical protein
VDLSSDDENADTGKVFQIFITNFFGSSWIEKWFNFSYSKGQLISKCPSGVSRISALAF